MNKTWVLFLVTVVVTSLFTLVWYEYVDINRIQRYTFMRFDNFTFLDFDAYYSTPENTTHVILMWTKIYGRTFNVWSSKHERLDLKKCPYNCIFTENRAFKNNASLFVFHVRDFNEKDLPTKTNDEQQYVFYTVESPYHSRIGYKRVPIDYFDITMTYRMDSVSLAAYDAFEKIEKDTKKEEIWTWDEVKKKVNAKNKTALWFVSHCHTPSKRENYVNALKKHANVSVFGSCVRKNCNYKCEMAEIEKHYFYLAFENSVCQDYITEKFWRVKNIIVPITLDRKVVPEYIPKDSYIATSDFETPKDLADHLHYLMRNKTAYMQYFKWIETYKKSNHKLINSDAHCKLCEIAHTGQKFKVQDIDEWWEKKSVCVDNYGDLHSRPKKS